MPLPVPSVAARVSVGVAYQPLRIAGLSVAVETGLVWSTFTVTVFAGVSTLPAPSVDQKVRRWLPSAEIENGAVYACEAPPSTVYCVPVTPEPPGLSVADSVTCTGPRYQPFEPVGEAGDRAAVVVGAVPSVRNDRVLVASTLPALSTDQNVSVWFPSDRLIGPVYVCCDPPSSV